MTFQIVIVFLQYPKSKWTWPWHPTRNVHSSSDSIWQFITPYILCLPSPLVLSHLVHWDWRWMERYTTTQSGMGPTSSRWFRCVTIIRNTTTTSTPRNATTNGTNQLAWTISTNPTKESTIWSASGGRWRRVKHSSGMNKSNRGVILQICYPYLLFSSDYLISFLHGPWGNTYSLTLWLLLLLS